MWYNFLKGSFRGGQLTAFKNHTFWLSTQKLVVLIPVQYNKLIGQKLVKLLTSHYQSEVFVCRLSRADAVDWLLILKNRILCVTIYSYECNNYVQEIMSLVSSNCVGQNEKLILYWKSMSNLNIL